MKNERLKKALEDYKEYTLDLIYNLEKHNYDILEEILIKRQAVINDINTLKYTKEEFSKAIEKLEILLYEKKLTVLMAEKREEIKQNINKLNSAKNANHSYNKALYNSKIFNKEI